MAVQRKRLSDTQSDGARNELQDQSASPAVQETDPAAACELAQLVVLDTYSLQRSATSEPSARYSEPAVLKKWRKTAADTAVKLAENLNRLKNLLSNQTTAQTLHAANSYRIVSVAGEPHLSYCAAALRFGLLLFRQVFDAELPDEVGSDSIKLWLENDTQLESLKYHIMQDGVTTGYPFDERSEQFFRDLIMQIQSEQFRLLGHPEKGQGESKHETSKATTRGKRATVNMRMLDELTKDHSVRGWTCKQWATHLTCSPSSVVATESWKQLAMEREQLKAERANDRQRRLKGSEQQRD